MAKTWFQARKNKLRAEIFIYADIGAFGVTAQDFVTDLRKLGKVTDIDLHINSLGGSVFDGIAIYNALRTHPARVVTHVDGVAASMGSAIAMVGDEIVMPSNAWMMIHDPSGGTFGPADDHRKTAELLDGLKKTLVSIYSARTGIDGEDIEKMMSEETWMDGNQALDLGFATQVTAEEAIAAHFDLSKFSAVPDAVRELSCGPAASLSAIGENMPDKNETATAAVEDQPKVEVTASAQKKKEHDALVKELSSVNVTAHENKPQTPGAWAGSEANLATAEVAKKVDIQAEAKRLAQERVDLMKAAYDCGRNLGLEAETQKLIDNEVEFAEIPRLLIEIYARRQKQDQVVKNLVPSGASVGFSHDNPAIVRSRISDAIASQFVPGMKCPDASRQYMGWRPQDMMRDCLERAGHVTARMTRSEIVDAALHSTSDFPELLGTSANKIFLGAYEVAPATFRTVMSRVDLANFQIHNMLRDGDFPTLQEVMESGEFTRGTMSESKETAQLKTYGRTFGISRQSLVNDTLARFGQTVAKIGQAVARFENKTAWAIVTANATMADGYALYQTANHGNLASSGAAISATTLGAGRSAMRTQTSLDGETINVAPAYLAVPAAKETVAEQILNPLTVVTSAADIATTSQRQLSLVVEPLLDANSTTAWYLFSNPAMGSAIVYGYLEGESAPRVRTNDPFNVDGIEFQVRLDFHAAAVDYRYTYKNAGN